MNTPTKRGRKKSEVREQFKDMAKEKGQCRVTCSHCYAHDPLTAEVMSVNTEVMENHLRSCVHCQHLNFSSKYVNILRFCF